MPATSDDLAKSLGLTTSAVAGHLTDLENRQDALRVGKDRWMGRKNADILKESLIRNVRSFHEKNPLRTGISRAELRSAVRQPVDPLVLEWALSALEKDGGLVVAGDRIRQQDFHASLDPEEEKIRSRIESLLMDQPFAPPDTSELIAKLGKNSEPVLSFLIESGTIVRVEESLVFHRKALDMAVEKVRSFLDQKKQATVSEIRQHLGTTRKYAVPLLIHLDTLGVTEREGDLRRLRE
jgi:selenocysteine-specific elongation factor